jgi:hypothetical protein
LLRLSVPFAQVAARLGIFRVDLAESLHAADGVTYWASHAKAMSELGFAPRPLSQGAVDAFRPAG